MSAIKYIMSSKNPSEQIYSRYSSKLSELRKAGIQHGSYQGLIKRQSVLFSNWKPITLTLIESPHQQLMITIRKRNEQRIEEVINLTFSKISKRFATVDHHPCFGIIVPSKKRYLLACSTEEQTIDLYTKLANLKNEIKNKHDQSIDKDYRDIIEEASNQLEFEKCESEEDEGKFFSTNAQTPKKESELLRAYPLQRERDVEESFYTAIEDEQPQENIVEQVPLHLEHPISEEQIKCIESDEGFKLLHNFNDGRFLTKSREYIKANLLVSSSLSTQQLLQTFSHLQLWNQKVKSYSIINRIDKGIYLAKLELHRRNLFSLPMYCYMMVNTWKFEQDDIVIFRSLEQDQFDKQLGYAWISMNLWVRAKSSNEDHQKLMNICAHFTNQKDFSVGLAFLQEIQTYHTFLRTSGQLPHHTLEWNERQEIE